MSVERLINEIFENSISGFEKLPIELADKIRNYGEENFISHLIASYPNLYVQNFLVSHREIWNSFTLDAWKRILVSLQDNEISLYTIISYLSKYRIVDSLNVYKGIPDINERVRKGVLEYFSERPGLLKLHKFELKNLIDNDVNWVDIEPEDDNIIKIED